MLWLNPLYESRERRTGTSISRVDASINLGERAADIDTSEEAGILSDMNVIQLVAEAVSIPQDPDFWPFLFGESKKWGLAVYNQDWQDFQVALMT
jgi:hypothetical protein